LYTLKSRVRAGGVSVSGDETHGIFAIVAFAQEEHDAPALSRLQHDSDLKRRAGIERPAELP
jgi:hypothetical protein